LSARSIAVLDSNCLSSRDLFYLDYPLFDTAHLIKGKIESESKGDDIPDARQKEIEEMKKIEKLAIIAKKIELMNKKNKRQ
jgi:hypothetical protein